MRCDTASDWRSIKVTAQKQLLCAVLYSCTARDESTTEYECSTSFPECSCNAMSQKQSEAKSRSGAAWQRRTHRQRVPLWEIIWYYNYCTVQKNVLYSTSYPRVWIVADAMRCVREGSVHITVEVYDTKMTILKRRGTYTYSITVHSVALHNIFLGVIPIASEQNETKGSFDKWLNEERREESLLLFQIQRGVSFASLLSDCQHTYSMYCTVQYMYGLYYWEYEYE